MSSPKSSVKEVTGKFHAAARAFGEPGGYALATDAEPFFENYDAVVEEDHAEAVRFLMGHQRYSQFRAYRTPMAPFGKHVRHD